MATDEDRVPCCQRPHHPGNDYCNHCGKQFLKPLMLRRTSRHVFCIRCGINGERSTHAYCGVCGDGLKLNWGDKKGIQDKSPASFFTTTGPPPPPAPAFAFGPVLDPVPPPDLALPTPSIALVNPSNLIAPASTTRSHKRGGTRKNKANKRAKTSITSGAIGDGHGADASGAGHVSGHGGHDAAIGADIGA